MLTCKLVSTHTNVRYIHLNSEKFPHALNLNAIELFAFHYNRVPIYLDETKLEESVVCHVLPTACGRVRTAVSDLPIYPPLLHAPKEATAVSRTRPISFTSSKKINLSSFPLH